ncbi:MAG: dephospho-CoA kinase [Chloroflexi bacterium RBG_16_56_11]|nr:MAG: dephospho-CoA kinase [Chloroflexi bacterium RBG_16_56_11]
MKVIGLTGGIGSGKSTVAKILEEMGATIVDMDSLGHEAVKKGSWAWESIVREFGEEILAADSEIDRARLGKIVFNDKKALSRLNRIVHPEIDRLLKAGLEEHRRRGVKVAVVEAAAMLEAGREYKPDELWVTVAPRDTVLRRIAGRGGLSEKEARARIKSQLSNEERRRHADVVIDTDGTLAETRAKVVKEWEELLKRL